MEHVKRGRKASPRTQNNCIMFYKINQEREDMLQTKQSLESLEWRESRIGDIFEVVNTKPYHKANLKIGGKLPYITRTSFDNGLEDVVFNEGFSINPKNTISLGAENADFFYQGIEYLTGNKMYYLSNKHINRYVGLFLVQTLQKSIQNCGFGYGKGLTGTRLKNRKLLLPTDSKGQPHWEFMESFMRKIENKQLISYLRVLDKGSKLDSGL